jgi:REP element-mobilizing transposase RayT
LNEIGIIAEKYWNEIPNKFTDVNLDQFVVMPNHIHGIMIILNKINNLDSKSTQGDVLATIQPLIRNSVSSIINHYKGKLKKWCNKNGEHFNWQARFTDHN